MALRKQITEFRSPESAIRVGAGAPVTYVEWLSMQAIRYANGTFWRDVHIEPGPDETVALFGTTDRWAA